MLRVIGPCGPYPGSTSLCDGCSWGVRKRRESIERLCKAQKGVALGSIPGIRGLQGGSLGFYTRYLRPIRGSLRAIDQIQQAYVRFQSWQLPSCGCPRLCFEPRASKYQWLIMACYGGL